MELTREFLAEIYQTVSYSKNWTQKDGNSSKSWPVTFALKNLYLKFIFWIKIGEHWLKLVDSHQIYPKKKGYFLQEKSFEILTYSGF